MMSRFLCGALPAILCASLVSAQTAPTVALHENIPAVHAFTNARIVVKPGTTIPQGTLVIRDGVIEAVGQAVTPPADARVWDLSGATLYAGMIDLASDYGMPKTPPPGPGVGQSQLPPSGPKGAAHWNAKMLADTKADGEFVADVKAAEKLRSQGFTMVHALPQKGIFRGSSALISLAEATAAETIARGNVAQVVALETGGFGGGPPSSLMGAVAFIRQMFLDADWYRRAWDAYTRKPAQQKPETNNALAALVDAALGRQPVLMSATDEFNFLRAAKIGKEFGLKLWILGSGSEFRRLEAVKNAKLPVVLPLNFPETPGVDSPEEALNVTLEELMMWDVAPENPGRLAKAGVPLALTTSQLKDPGTFLAQVRKAIDRGLSADEALAAVTTTPAQWLGVESVYGTLEKGRRANIIVADGELFAEKTKIREVWVNGKRFEVKPPAVNDPRGVWDLKMTNDPTSSGTLTLKGDPDKLTGSTNWHGKEVRHTAVTFSAGRISFSLPGDSAGLPGIVRMSGTVSATEMYGVGEGADGIAWRWNATRKEPAKEEPDTSKPKKPEMASFPDVYPLGEFGRSKYPDQQTVLLKNATVWTEGPQGKLEGADVLVAKGKIQKVGMNLTAPANAAVIDATGKHVSPGIIDCHSHIAVSGSVNEFGPAITCNVRIADVLDADDIWIYRQLAGGTVAANILHGSANPIGGQNAIIKHRWGALPDELLIQGAPQGVKFALGENVKQSHVSGGQGRSQRYPHTRMGVDEIIRDRFQASLDYERSWKDWEKDKSAVPPRKDLELEAVLEMVKGTRKIHAHSYRQDEILALIRAADDYHIKIATFQHALEAYKVADAIAKHGAGASGFTDWWAYKHEAYDAIPGNFPLVAKQGVVVSFNSDDAQLATRLNWEAAKAVPYGVSEEEALKYVTINPAKQLGIDAMTGSLEPGKDADFVLWSGNPLSTYSKCEQTWVDGRKMFDIAEDAQMQADALKERGALIQKALKSKTPTPPPATTGPSRFRRPGEEQPKHCDDGIEEYEMMVNGGGL